MWSLLEQTQPQGLESVFNIIVPEKHNHQPMMTKYIEFKSRLTKMIQEILVNKRRQWNRDVISNILSRGLLSLMFQNFHQQSG